VGPPVGWRKSRFGKVEAYLARVLSRQSLRSDSALNRWRTPPYAHGTSGTVQRDPGLLSKCTMRAMVLDAARSPLRFDDQRPTPQAGTRELLIRVRACGVCRTDLHLVDGELPHPKSAVIPGHEIVGTVEAVGAAVTRYRIGDRVGVPWLGWTCGECSYCRSERENLCDRAKFTGYQLDGGYAEFTTADERYAFPISASWGDVDAAPLLCAGMIGYRALRMAGPVRRLGFYGFGAAAHIAIQVARYRGQEVYAFTRPGDKEGQEFARTLGAVWAGSSEERPPELLEGALLFAPVGPLVPLALAATAKGGTVVCAGIHMSDIPSFPYELLWGERVVRSVANLTRRDGEEFLAIAQETHVRTTTRRFALPAANEALTAMRSGQLEGTAVIVP
jgi:alcohol dehydrogenase, propanol-preferring